MMDHLRERWECIRDFVYFDGVIRIGQDDISEVIDSQKVLFPSCDEYLARPQERQMDPCDELFFKNNWDMGNAKS